MELCLHNPDSRAHVEELKDRLLSQRGAWRGERERQAVVEALASVVAAMDSGAIAPEEARAFFDRMPVPGFSFDRWLAEMVEEGVYVRSALREAA